MYWIALKMLIEDRAKYIGMILSLTFSAIIITQQCAIFLGVLKRTYSTVTTTSQADIWVMDPNVQYVDDVNPLRQIDLFRVRSIEGVEWAEPFFKESILARLSNGQFQTCTVFGIDNATFIGAPPKMLEGRIEDLRGPDAIIVDSYGAHTKLARNQGPGKPKIPLRVGDVLELNDNRCFVVGICEVQKTLFSEPIVYMTYQRAITIAPFTRKLLSFILVKAKKGIALKDLCNRIHARTNFMALTNRELEVLTMWYYLKNTGLPINFGLAVLFGILVGAIITGQIFYNFTSENLKYLAIFSVMGASRGLLARMTLLQAVWIGVFGWAIGSGIAACISLLTFNTELSFYLPLRLLLGTLILMLTMCIIASLISIRRIYQIDLATTIFGR